MLLAQTLTGFGLGGLFDGIESGLNRVVDEVLALEPTEWALVVVAGGFLWWLLSRR